MTNLFWFSNEEGENVVADYFGDLYAALRIAAKWADEHNECCYVNCNKDIVGVAWPCE